MNMVPKKILALVMAGGEGTRLYLLTIFCATGYLASGPMKSVVIGAT